MIANNQ